MYSPDHKPQGRSKDVVVRYGALANKYFPLFNEDMAAAITGNGRYFIRMLANYIEETLQGMHKSADPYVIYGDTDSCLGSTVIRTSLGPVKIEDLYDQANGRVDERGPENFVKHLDGSVEADSVSGDLKLEAKPVRYVMKHKVKKRMFCIKCEGDSVVVTEDHSLMVVRGGELTEVKPAQVRPEDAVVKAAHGTGVSLEQDFEAEDLGVQEDWVYDIEVDDNHNFFGNDILVHNSVYFQIAPFMEMYQTKNPDLDLDHYVEWADQFEKKVIQPVIEEVIDDFARELNAFDKNALGVEREIIADCLSGKTRVNVRKGGETVAKSLSELAAEAGISGETPVTEIVDVSEEGIEVLSYDERTGKNELKKVLNVQKKTTTKQMVELVAPDGRAVELTEDHRVAVLEDGRVTYKSAGSITEDTAVVNGNPIVSQEVPDLIKGFCVRTPPGESAERTTVYDIEVEDNHNFYAENVLVHNCGVFAAKKMYFARVRDDEGKRFPADDPKIKVMGMDIIKSSTPVWSKKYLKEAIPHILDKDEGDLKEWLREIKKEFVSAPLNEIAMVGGANNLDYDLDNPSGPVPIGSRAAIRHNMYIAENGLENLYAPIQPGDKSKRLFLTEPNPFNTNVIAFTNDQFVREIAMHDCVDYDENFYKGFMKPLELMVKSLEYDMEKETEELDDW